MQKTFKQLLEADSVVAELYSKDKALENSKFGYAWRKFYKENISELRLEMFDKIEDYRIDNALEDPKTKEILYAAPDMTGHKQYKYSKEDMKRLVSQIRELTKEYDSKVIDIKPYISSYVPELTEEETETLKGLVIE
jgi:hypothetical protein